MLCTSVLVSIEDYSKGSVAGWGKIGAGVRQGAQGSGARKTCDDAKSVTNRLIYGGAADRGKGLKKESRDGCCFGCFTVVFGGFGAGGPRRDGLCGWRCTTLFTTERWE